MLKVFAGVFGVCALAACAGQPQPTERLAASMAAVRGAETAGAAQVPQAALHLKLAQEQISQAEKAIADDDNERGDSLAVRASSDAELALALAREAQFKQKLETYAEAHPQVSANPEPRNLEHRNINQPIDANSPAGVGAPKTAPSAGAAKP